MKSLLPLVALSAMSLALSGCGISVLREPLDIQRDAQAYVVPALAERNPRYVISFDYSGCVEDAVVASEGMSGASSVSAMFGARKIIRDEFELVQEANFVAPAPGLVSQGVVFVETEKVLVDKSWSTYTVEMVFDIEVVGIVGGRRQRIFRKKYRVSDKSREKEKDLVPQAFYGCVQQVAKEFAEDLSMCHDIAEVVRHQSKED